MPTIGCPTCAVLRRIAPEYSDPSIICPECRQWQTPPSAALDESGTPMKKMADDADDGAFQQDDGRRKPRGRDDDDEDRDRPAPKKGGGAGMSIGIILAIVAGVLLVCMCVPMVLAGFLIIPAVQKVREAAARTQSTNNLKELGLGFHGFHDANKRLPFNGASQPQGYSLAAIGGNPSSGSWGFQVLPHMMGGRPGANPVSPQQIYAKADRNADISTFICPGRGRPTRETSNGGGAWTDYFLNAYLNDNAGKPDAADSKRTMVGVTDGTSNTVFVGHGNISTGDYAKNANVTGSSNIFVGGTLGTMRAGGAGNGVNPPGVLLQKDSDKAPAVGNWGGPFPQGALMCFGDASVRLVPYSTPNFNAFLTPAGNEAIRLPD